MPILKSPATYDDLIAAPDNLIAEIVGGRLYGTPRLKPLESLVASAISGILYAFHRNVQREEDWWILRMVEVHLGEDVVVPDLSGWSRRRLPNIPDAPWMSLAPDWVCEVAVPSTERLDRVEKLPVYAREGVGHVWIVNPANRTLEIFRLDGPSWKVVGAFGGEGLIRVEPFEAIEWDLGRLWGDLEAGSPHP